MRRKQSARWFWWTILALYLATALVLLSLFAVR